MNYPYGLSVRTFGLTKGRPRLVESQTSNVYTQSRTQTKQRTTAAASAAKAPGRHYHLMPIEEGAAVTASSTTPAAASALPPSPIPSTFDVSEYVQAVEEADRVAIDLKEAREFSVVAQRNCELHEIAAQSTRQQNRLHEAICGEKQLGHLSQERDLRRRLNAGEIGARHDLMQHSQQQSASTEPEEDMGLSQQGEDNMGAPHVRNVILDSPSTTDSREPIPILRAFEEVLPRFHKRKEEPEDTRAPPTVKQTSPQSSIRGETCIEDDADMARDSEEHLHHCWTHIAQILVDSVLDEASYGCQNEAASAATHDIIAAHQLQAANLTDDAISPDTEQSRNDCHCSTATEIHECRRQAAEAFVDSLMTPQRKSASQ